jgi:DNA-binding CsgD family transcriptional regulator
MDCVGGTRPSGRMGDAAGALLAPLVCDLALGAEGCWRAVLEALADALGCHYAAVVATTPDRTAPRSLGAIGITMEDHLEFLRTWHKDNVYGTRRPARQEGAIVLGRDVVPRAELVHSAMYQSYLAPRELEELIRLDVLHDRDRSVSITFARRWSQGAFTAEELSFAQAAMRHLQRGARVQARLEESTAIAHSALDALEVVQAPVMLLDAQGRVLHASAAAVRLLDAKDGLSVGGMGALRAATPALSARLAELLDRAGGRSGESGALRLSRPSGKPDLTLIAIPLRPDCMGGGARQPAILLQMTDPLARATPEPSLLMEAFGLTMAEAGLATDLTRGLSVAKVAANSGRSVATVRTHLASVLAKTGTARQSELVGLLARLASCPGAEPRRGNHDHERISQ